MKTYEVLEKALAEIQKGWTQYTREVQGKVCAVGAIQRVETGSAWGDCFSPAKESIEHIVGRGEVAHFNDSHAHTEVVALFQEAIRAEKAKEGIPLDVEAPVEVPA